MPVDRNQIESFMRDLGARRDEAEAMAENAKASVLRMASGIVDLDGLDPQQIRAAADDFADALSTLKALAETQRRLNSLLF